MKKEIKEPKNIKLPDQEKKENGEKLNFWKRIWISIKDFDRYQELASEKVSVAVGYLMKLVLIFVIIATASSVYRFHISFQQVLEYFNQNIEELKIENGTLEVKQEEPIRMENIDLLDGIVIIDTITTDQATIQGYTEEIKNTNDSVVFLKDRILYKNSMLSEPVEYTYDGLMENLGVDYLDKQAILDYFSIENLTTIYGTIFFVMLIYLYMIYLASTFVDVVILSFLGYLTTKLTGLRIRYSALFNMGIYAITLSVLLNMLYLIIYTFTGFVIEYFQVMYTAISYIYIVTAILLIKSDLIKKQMELMKIQEEQEKIREELRQKEEEEKLKQEEEERRKRRKEKRKKEKEKEEKENTENNGPTPEGNNA